MGGLMALYTGLRLPHIFNHVLSQSGAFSSDEYDPVVYDLIRHIPVQPVKIWMGVGAYDFTDILTGNRAMLAALQEHGYTVCFRQNNAGHNFPAWRDDVWRGLEWLYGSGLRNNQVFVRAAKPAPLLTACVLRDSVGLHPYRGEGDTSEAQITGVRGE